ncbi:MAG TPA: twin-arginine translocase TatA/TatE family subunit [Caulobacteraceae bacterium]|nr:twin-arginine translocase TatA/TatE family subunit [Caulobacteraceae bacterium]
MGSLSPIHWLIIVAVLLLIFARPGKLSGFMGDAAKGIRAFRDGLKADEHDKPPAAEPQPLPPPSPEKDPIVR